MTKVQWVERDIEDCQDSVWNNMKEHQLDPMLDISMAIDRGNGYRQRWAKFSQISDQSRICDFVNLTLGQTFSSNIPPIFRLFAVYDFVRNDDDEANIFFILPTAVTC